MFTSSKRMGDYLCENYTSNGSVFPYVSRSELDDYLKYWYFVFVNPIDLI